MLEKLVSVQEGRIAVTVTCARGLPKSWPIFGEDTTRLLGEAMAKMLLMGLRRQAKDLLC
jgi:hypothetical protein